MSKHHTPYDVVLRLIGSPKDIGAICGIDPKASFQWRWPNSQRDAGDVPRPVLMRRLLNHSDQHGLGLTAEHLIRGASEAEIEAILAARGQATPGKVAAE